MQIIDSAAIEAFDRFLQQTAQDLGAAGVPAPRWGFLWDIRKDDRTWALSLDTAGLPLRDAAYSGATAAIAIANAIAGLSGQLHLIREAQRLVDEARPTQH